MKWIIQTIGDEDPSILQAAKELNLDVELLNVKQVYERQFNDEYGIIHATIDSVKHLHLDGVYNLCPFKSLRCQTYYAYWGEYLFNKEYIMLPASEVPRRFNELHKILDSEDLFFRPDTNDKIFTGGVYSKEEFEKMLYFETITKETLVIAAPGYKIDREWRCFMHNGKLVESSLYKENGKLHLLRDDHPKEFVESVPMYTGLPSVYVLDVAEAEGNLYLLEPGSANCAGLYACDPKPIISVVVTETELLKAESE